MSHGVRLFWAEPARVTLRMTAIAFSASSSLLNVRIAE